VCLRGKYFFNVEAEMQALLEFARQFGHHADHFDVAALPLIGQSNSQPLFGLPCGMIEADAHG
jgi:hypothetical protein